MLSTGVLAVSSDAWYATIFDPVYGVIQACGDFVASNLTTAGVDRAVGPKPDSGHNPTTINKVIWVMWARSLLWLIYCVTKKIQESDRFSLGATKLGSVYQPRFAMSDRLPMGSLCSRLSQGLFIITWSMSLGYQLWLYAVILRGSIVNYLELRVDLNHCDLGSLHRRVRQSRNE